MLKNEKGVISVFLLLIFLAVLMLAGLIVDISRIMVAERKVQNALDTATRSVLAEYDEELVGQFGLFGVSYTTEQEETLKHYFLVNLVDRHQNFHLLNYHPHEVKITGSLGKSILNDEVFKQQIMEYMKYKGPVLLTQNVVDIFLQGAFGKKADLLGPAQATNESLKKINISQEKVNKALKNLTDKAVRKALDKLLSLETIQKSIVDLENKIAEYEKLLKQDNERIEEIAQEMEKALNKAEQVAFQDEKFKELKELKKLKESLNKLQEDLEFNKTILQQIAVLEKELDQLKIGEDEETSLEEMKDLIAQTKRLKAEIKELNQQLRPLTEITLFKINNVLPSLQKEKKEEKSALRKQLEKLYGKRISAEDPLTLLIEQSDFAAANNEDNNEDGDLGQTLNYEDKMTKLTEEKAEEIGKNVFDYLKKITTLLGKVAQDSTEKMYLTEYVMDKYTFVTSPTKRGHFFSKGEVEYILCGNNAETTNLISTFMKIWGLRFAINTVDSFFANPAPTFLTRLGIALVKGFSCATSDMLAMYSGKGAPICNSLEKVPTRLSYSDHLRLLLLMKSEKTQLDRMRQLIQLDIRQKKADFTLKSYGTMIMGKAEVSIDLWFAPLLQLDKLGIERIKGNRYIIVKTAVAEY